MSTVLVIGATGKTGSALLDLLRARAEPVRAASRTPNAADAIRFDWDEIATHGPALDGVGRVYLVPPPSAVDPVPVVEPFLAEARRRGIRRLVMLGSAIEFPHAPRRLELAARVRGQPGWLVLSPSGFMQNFLRPHPVGTAIRDHGEIATSAGSGRVGWIDARDVAASAAAALTEPLLGEQLRNDYVLTGPRGLSYTDAATIITNQTGRSVHVRSLTVDQLTARYRAAGLPAEFADSLAATEDDVRAGRYDGVTTSVLDLTGRPPRTFEDFVREHAAEWQPSGTLND
jgi:uncharacterized protein YbjT (DUF2867 family)